MENNKAKVLWDFVSQIDNLLKQGQSTRYLGNGQILAVVYIYILLYIYMNIESDGNNRQKEHEKLEKYCGLKGENKKRREI